MSVRANVKPLMHWLIYHHYTVRITERAATYVTGVMTTPAGPVNFRYDTAAQIIHLPTENIPINEYGWEIEP